MARGTRIKKETVATKTARDATRTPAATGTIGRQKTTAPATAGRRPGERGPARGPCAARRVSAKDSLSGEFEIAGVCRPLTQAERDAVRETLNRTRQRTIKRSRRIQAAEYQDIKEYLDNAQKMAAAELARMQAAHVAIDVPENTQKVISVVDAALPSNVNVKIDGKKFYNRIADSIKNLVPQPLRAGVYHSFNFAWNIVAATYSGGKWFFNLIGSHKALTAAGLLAFFVLWRWYTSPAAQGVVNILIAQIEGTLLLEMTGGTGISPVQMVQALGDIYAHHLRAFRNGEFCLTNPELITVAQNILTRNPPGANPSVYESLFAEARAHDPSFLYNESIARRRGAEAERYTSLNAFLDMIKNLATYSNVC